MPPTRVRKEHQNIPSDKDRRPKQLPSLIAIARASLSGAFRKTAERSTRSSSRRMGAPPKKYEYRKSARAKGISSRSAQKELKNQIVCLIFHSLVLSFWGPEARFGYEVSFHKDWVQTFVYGWVWVSRCEEMKKITKNDSSATLRVADRREVLLELLATRGFTRRSV